MITVLENIEERLLRILHFHGSSAYITPHSASLVADILLQEYSVIYSQLSPRDISELNLRSPEKVYPYVKLKEGKLKILMEILNK